MKSPLKITLAALVVTLALSPFVRADGDTPPPPPAGEGQGPGGPDGHRGGPRMDRMKMLDEQLTLTDAQKEKIKPILADERKAMQALRDDKTLSKEDHRTKMGEIMKSSSAKIREVLTPEQQTKFDAMQAEMAKRGPGGRREK